MEKKNSNNQIPKKSISSSNKIIVKDNTKKTLKVKNKNNDFSDIKIIGFHL